MTPPARPTASVGKGMGLQSVFNGASAGQPGIIATFIDSLEDLRRAAVDELRFREYLYSLLKRCTRKQISVMMSQETPGPFGTAHLTEGDISHLSDNVILLQFAPHDGQLHRTVTVLKTRKQTRSRHPRVHHHSRGIVLSEPRSNSTRR